MAEPSPGLLRTIRAIDAFTTWSGKLIAWLILPLVAAVTYEVFARYLFHAPTIWSYDLTYMLSGGLFMLGTAYALRRGAHIRTDIFWERYSVRTKGRVDAAAYLLFFFPGIAMLLLASLDEAIYTFSLGERSEQTAWRPLFWPFKAVVPPRPCCCSSRASRSCSRAVHAARTGVRRAARGAVV